MLTDEHKVIIKSQNFIIKDFISRFHTFPNLELVSEVRNKDLGEYIVRFKADDMAFYSFCYNFKTGKWSRRVFVNVESNMWSDE